MYDAYLWEDPFDGSDLPFDDCLDPDKPFSMNLSDNDLMDIAERGFDQWLMGLSGIL